MRQWVAILIVVILLGNSSQAIAQHSCALYAQSHQQIDVQSGQVLQRQVEIDFSNTGSSTWQNTGGVSNLSYIELRPVSSSGLEIEGPLYHSSWINRKRVGSFLQIQQGVAPGQVARFVFDINIDANTLGIGSHDMYFRPYHADGHWISDWGQCHIRVVVSSSTSSGGGGSTSPPPTTTPTISPRITSVVLRRTQISSSGGSYIEDYDMLLYGVEPLKDGQIITVSGTSDGGSAYGYEWSLEQNGATKVLGNLQTLRTKAYELYLGKQNLRLRVKDSQGNYTSYAEMQIEVQYWPILKFPFNGEWEWNFSDYGTNYHIGSHLTAKDWNKTGGALKDFGMLLTADVSGTVTTGNSSSLGKYVLVEHIHQASGSKFQSQFCHLSTQLVETGDVVSQGNPVGLCGNTGNSSGPHLHHILRKYVNGAWVPVIAEPIWQDPFTLLQQVRFGDRVRADNLVFQKGKHVLPEVYVAGASEDIYGFGNHKYYSTTVVGTPTVYANWDITLQDAGEYQLFMHNPTGITNSSVGIESHNTTSNAVFELTLPGQPGYQTFSVDQGNSSKGSLIEVCRFTVKAGDRVSITQHNGTGESGREITFDDLVLKMVSQGGGSGGQTSTSSGSGTSGTTTSSGGSTNTPSSGGSGRGGGGCSMGFIASAGGIAEVSFILLMSVMVLMRIRLHQY